jgi:hypothetical protein
MIINNDFLKIHTGHQAPEFLHIPQMVSDKSTEGCKSILRFARFRQMGFGQ